MDPLRCTYVTTNVPDIVIIVVLSLLIICVDLGLYRIVGHVQRERDPKDYRRLAWKSNGLLQLHSLAYEEAGFGTWERCTEAVPVTARGEVLAVLDLNDPEHPVLLKTVASQTIQPVSTPQTVNTTGPVATPPEVESKSVNEVHETGVTPRFILSSLYTDFFVFNRTSQSIISE